MKRYGVIIADPPWDYDQAHVGGGVDYQYQTMRLADLAALPVQNIAAEDAVLLLWATWPKLNSDCLPLMKAWGFEYVTGFPWLKIASVGQNFSGEVEVTVPYGIGFWARGCSEIVLIGRRGNVSPPTAGFIGLLSPNLYHSRKPDSLYDYAETLPGPYLEMFARRRREGWDVFGNAVKGSISLEAVK